jgi:putative nucleotidyltransferase with HDIG domain
MSEKPDKERLRILFDEVNEHLLNDNKPSVFLNSKCKVPDFQAYPFQMLYQLIATKQSPVYHPEGSVWNHTLMVVDEAALRKVHSKNIPVFMWAALLHDIGKPPATKIRKGKITSYNHEKIGAEIANEFLSVWTNDQDFIQKVCSLVRFHMQMLFVTRDLPFAQIQEMKQHTDLDEVALLGLCDKLGRIGSDQDTEIKNMKLFLEKCRKS